jgi:hypothetical protein
MNPENAAKSLIESGAFGALSVILLAFIWWLIREQNRRDHEHVLQIERINAAHDANVEKINAANNANIERITTLFTSQIDKMSAMAQQERKDSTAAFNSLSSLLQSVIEKRGSIELHNN